MGGENDFFAALTELKELPDETIHGTSCFHYTARTDMNYLVDQWIEEYEDLRLSEPEFFTDTLVEQEVSRLEPLKKAEIFVEYWISKSDGLFRQIIIETEELIEGNIILMKDSYTRIVYYNINQPITINPPETVFGKLLPGWQLIDYSTSFE